MKQNAANVMKRAPNLRYTYTYKTMVAIKIRIERLLSAWLLCNNTEKIFFLLLNLVSSVRLLDHETTNTLIQMKIQNQH